jgi:hypothetical protein
MATTQLTIFDQGAGLPAHLADLGDAPNVVGKSSVDQLSFRGKVWRVIVDGAEEVVKNGEGDPVGSVNVVVLDYSKKRSRAYYAGGYEEGKTSAPTCWSQNGDVPDANVPAAQKQCSVVRELPAGGEGREDHRHPARPCPRARSSSAPCVVPVADLNFPRCS